MLKIAFSSYYLRFTHFCDRPGPQIKRSGLAGFVGNLAKTATVDDSQATAKVFMITKEEERVFLREP